jgi:hypothetical protein
MATKPYTVEVTATLPPDDGQPLATLDYQSSGTFTHKSEQELVLSGSGTQVVSFGSIPSTGAKLLFVEYPQESVSNAVINLRINGSEDDIPLFPGGSLLISNPSPTGTGITALSLVHTAVATVRVTALA